MRSLSCSFPTSKRVCACTVAVLCCSAIHRAALSAATAACAMCFGGQAKPDVYLRSCCGIGQPHPAMYGCAGPLLSEYTCHQAMAVSAPWWWLPATFYSPAAAMLVMDLDVCDCCSCPHWMYIFTWHGCSNRLSHAASPASCLPACPCPVHAPCAAWLVA